MKPRRFAVIGDPVGHSKSPAMHRAAYRALGLPHDYEALRVTAAELPRVVEDLREGRYDGLNVTVPHKRAALALSDAAADPTLTAANTLVRAGDGRVVAHNTDVPALAEELRLLAGPGASWSSRRALVLGSGGAALAAVAALRSLGSTDVVVRARTARAQATQPWQPSPASEARTLAVVQATSAGMAGADPGDAVAQVVAWDALPDDAVALDVVYAPPETPFLVAAGARGLGRANGLGMLARQGALAFELWLGVPAPLEVMRAALETGTGDVKRLS
ncbi:MAG TPA: shikimate dehydrogenase [Polyangiaceae bacterium]